MIRLIDITKKYVNGSNELVALNRLNIQIEKGDFLAIMGASGSGKTTLLNILGCMDVATEGEYYFENIPIHTLKQNKKDEFRKNHIGFIFQNFALLKDYTVKENIEIPLRAKGYGKKKREALVREMLEKVGLAEYEKSLPNKISGGQQQRVAIARALVSGASIILADEPTGALDSSTGQDVIDLLKRINRDDGKTVILVTHDEKIASQANHIIMLKDGRIVSDGDGFCIEKKLH
ncbi:MAG: ABC transporter ATP-binding protein [Lachnospiraceae bacterium]|nr:ABC transporter ATP-binding protein [Lachnospiraceae bacterium]